MSSYIDEFQKCSLESRKSDSSRLLTKYPDRCCIIVGRSDDSDLPDLDKHKFLVPCGLTMSQFQYVIRKKIRCRPEQGIYMFINKKLVPITQTVGNVFHENKGEDGYLYIRYTGENTFG